MLFKPLLGAQLSGSVGAITASRNRGGDYFRQRKIPVNPNTSFQSVVRGALNQLSSAWNDDLSQAQRDAWDVYAAAVSVVNRIGDQIFLTGQNMYIRSNTPAIQVGIPRQDTAPTIFDLGTFTDPTITSITTSPDDISLAFTVTDDWVGEDDSAMLVYASRPQNPTVNFGKIPMRFAGKIDGDATTPPTSPQLISMPFPIATGQKVFVQGRVIRADGRLSTLWFANALVTGG